VRINELHDTGDHNRFEFYERTKSLFVTPPAMHRVNQKHKPVYYVPNVTKYAITSNSLENGLYLAADDRRHDVTATPLPEGHFLPAYFQKLYRWFDDGGVGHVIAWLRARDLSRFNPKAPPHRGPAFWAIVNANRPSDDNAMDDLVALLKVDNKGTLPEAVTFDFMFGLLQKYPDCKLGGEIATLLSSLSSGPRRATAPLRMREIGYEVVHNPDSKDGRWYIGTRKMLIYARKELPLGQQIEAAKRFKEETTPKSP
jgi:hypothetical protein